MTPIQFIDWLDGALDLDELAQTVHGANQIAPELRDMIRRRMQAVDRAEVEAALPEITIAPPPSHAYRVTRDIPVKDEAPADKLSEETLAEIREALSRKVSEDGGVLKSFMFGRAPLAHDMLLRSPMGVVNTTCAV